MRICWNDINYYVQIDAYVFTISSRFCCVDCFCHQLIEAAQAGLVADLAALINSGTTVDFRHREVHIFILPVLLSLRLLASFTVSLTKYFIVICPAQTGLTSLILAAEKGHTECVRALLQAGAEKDLTSKVWVVFCVDMWS